MRILYAITSLGMGGAERQVLALADGMAARGHTVALLVLRGQLPEEWPTSHTVIRLEMRRTPPSVMAGVLRGRRFLREFEPDLVHSHGFHANLIARMLKVMRPATVILSTVHNVYEGGWSRMLAYGITDGLSRRMTAVSAAAADRYVHLKAVPRRKCAVVTNGIELSEYAPDCLRRAAMRDRMEAGDEFIWLAVGRVVPAKDFPNLLRAFRRVHAVLPQSQLWIAGELFDGSAARIESHHRDGVRWLGLRRDMVALYDASDAFVLSSAWEGMPLVAGEAMAMEKPVVATDVGGVRELVGDAGVLVTPGDPDTLAGVMIDMMRRTQEERDALGRAARRRVEDGFSMEAKGDEWDGLYRSVVRMGRTNA